METSTFFARFLHTPKDKASKSLPDDINAFDQSWTYIKETLGQPDERQLSRGIQATDVPTKLQHIVDALVYEGNRHDEDTTGACLEYFLKEDVLSQLVKLCEPDRPRGIKTEVVKAIHNMVVLMSEHLLVHNAVHRPLRRLLRSCVGDDPEDRIDGSARVMGAAAVESLGADSELELELVDLMCILCSRMRSYPPLLLIFFHDRSWQTHPAHEEALHRPTSPSPSARTAMSGTTSSSRRPQRFEFLLFSYLLRFVHREGRIGDFARAGLLFLFDIAFLPVADGDTGSGVSGAADPLQEAKNSLAEFVLDGDTCDVIAAGLGAVYSVLPTKLRIPSVASRNATVDATEGGMHLGGSEEALDSGKESPMSLSTDPNIQTQLDLLLKLLGFVHDVLSRGSRSFTTTPSQAVTPSSLIGAAITQATLASIEASFLGGILYPSILESSPNDGSAVAVMTYLQVMLTKLDDGELLDSLLRYLFGLDSTGRATFAGTRKKSSAMILLEREQRAPRSHPDYFTADGRFTLKDLVLDNLRSGVPEATASALELLQSLLATHCKLSLEGLLIPIKVDAATALAKLTPATDGLLALAGIMAPDSPDSDVFVYPGGGSDDILPIIHQTPSKKEELYMEEIALYANLLQRLDSSSTAVIHEAYMADVLRLLRDDPCFIEADATTGAIDEPDRVLGCSLQHRLSPSDPVLRTVMRLLADFFAHNPDENLALTGVVSALAMCPNRSLEGWLVCGAEVQSQLWDPDQVVHDDNDYDDEERSLDGGSSGQGRQGRQGKQTREDDLPALYQVILDLTRQIEGFRSKVANFDRYLSERRRGLLFAEHLDDAMNILLDIDVATFPEPAQRPELPKPRPSMASSLRSFLTPKKKSDPPTDSSSPNRLTPTPAEPSSAATSPFQAHYSHTKAVSVHHRPGIGVERGPWSPAKRRVADDPFLDASDDENQVGAEDLVSRPKKSTVTLSSVLDHCVILEEFVKEISSIIVARAICGVDQVTYM